MGHPRARRESAVRDEGRDSCDSVTSGECAADSEGVDPSVRTPNLGFQPMQEWLEHRYGTEPSASTIPASLPDSFP